MNRAKTSITGHARQGSDLVITLADGNHVATVTLTGGGTTTALTGPTFTVDMTPPAVEATW